MWKPDGFQWNALAWGDIKLHTHAWIFYRLSVASVHGLNSTNHNFSWISSTLGCNIFTSNTFTFCSHGLPSLIYVHLFSLLLKRLFLIQSMLECRFCNQYIYQKYPQKFHFWHYPWFDLSFNFPIGPLSSVNVCAFPAISSIRFI